MAQTAPAEPLGQFPPPPYRPTAVGASEPERPEDEQIRGILTVRIGNETRTVPTLKRVHSREWKQEIARSVGDVDLPDDDDIEAFVKSTTLLDDLIFKHVVAFDRTNALGGEEYLEQHADDRDIHDAFDEMLRSVSPKVDDPVASFARQVGSALGMAWARLVQLASERSTPGSPESTDGTPNRSTRRSAMSSSNSSGPTDRKPRSVKRKSGST